MKKGLKYYFITSIIVGVCIYSAQKTSFPLPRIVRFYVNDFLIIPIILSGSLYFLRWSKNDKNYKIPFWIILYISSFYTFIFEYFLPTFHLRYTADVIDSILYFISGFIFYYLQKNNS
tara:strand:- start:47329 stop:47682 length:354 start_codon:yes stop_codon:yes gene_type:complete